MKKSFPIGTSQYIPVGHTRLSHSFILKQVGQPQCVASQTPYTVKHFHIECRDLALIKQ